MNQGIRGFLFDLDGTFYEGGHLIAGALETIAWCSGNQVPFRFVTNTTSKPRCVVAENLGRMGLRVPPEWILTAPAAGRDILVARSFTRCHFLVRDALLEDFAGIIPVDENPQAVVVGDMGGGISHARLNRAFRLLLDENCAFLTLARNRFFRSSDGLEMDVGAYTAALEYASGRGSELIGKPARAFFLAAAAALGLEPENIAVVGDDIESDVQGAQAAGMRGILVRTGKFRHDQLKKCLRQPDDIWEGIKDLPSRSRSLCSPESQGPQNVA